MVLLFKNYVNREDVCIRQYRKIYLARADAT
jgi:hypothetical protein